jgi:hypothetical protein
VCDASGANSQRQEVNGDARANRPNVAPRTAHPALNRFRRYVSRRVGSIKHSIRSMGPLFRAQQPALPFLVGAVVSLAIAAPFYVSATGAPDVNTRGFVLVLTEDPTISLKVELDYARYVENSRDGDFAALKKWGHPEVGDDQITSLLFKLSRTSKKDSKPHRYLAIFSGDARLGDVGLYQSIETRSENRAHIDFGTVSSESDIQTYEGSIPDIGDQPELSGDLMGHVTDTAAGKTFVRIPSLGSIVEASSWTARDANEAAHFPPGKGILVSGKRWFTPKSVNYVALVGNLPVGKSIDEERPPTDVKHPTEIQWSGSEVLFPQAQLSDNIAEQKSQKRLFLAGVLGGVGGGFLVEGLSRLRRGRRAERAD